MKKIIHADNSDFFRKLMKSFLEAEGFEVESFENAQEANMAIAGGLGDMIIIGLTFSDIEGEKFLKKTIESFAGPVIVVSSSVDGKRAKKLIDIGAKAVINKADTWKEKLKLYLSSLK
jgi:DNA-binding NtrC family response regulator